MIFTVRGYFILIFQHIYIYILVKFTQIVTVKVFDGSQKEFSSFFWSDISDLVIMCFYEFVQFCMCSLHSLVCFFLNVFPVNSKYSGRCSKIMWSFGVIGTLKSEWSFIMEFSSFFTISLWLGTTSFLWAIVYTSLRSLRASTKATHHGFCSFTSVSRSSSFEKILSQSGPICL